MIWEYKLRFSALLSVLLSQMVKYGVIEMKQLLNDLISWSRLYISGRMHKPTTVLSGSPDIAEAQAQNIRSALNTALLLLPGAFSTEARVINK